MNRKAAAICILVFLAVAAAVTFEAINPSPSQPQQKDFTGSVSNSYGESLGFNVTASQQWAAKWGETASWYVGSTPYTKTHYAHDFKMTGQLIQNGSAHYKVQFRASYGATQSVRWSSERSNRYLGVVYSNSTDEQISTLASALSFATSNGSSNSVTFQAYIEAWATGAITGQTLYAHSTAWSDFSSNQINYVAVTSFSSSQTRNPTSVLDNNVAGSISWVNWGNALTENSIYASATGDAGTTYQTHYLHSSYYGFTIPDGATINSITLRLKKYESAGGVTDYHVYLTKTGTANGTDNKITGAWATSNTWYTYSGGLWGMGWTAAQINSGLFGAMLQVNINGHSPAYVAYVDAFEITVAYSVAASWFDDATAISTVLTFLTVLMTFCLVVIEIYRSRRRHKT